MKNDKENIKDSANLINLIDGGREELYVPSIGEKSKTKNPGFVKIGRELITKESSFTNDIFSELEKSKSMEFTICNVNKTVTDVLMRQTFFAIAQVLSNNSYQYGNMAEHTGTSSGGVVVTSDKKVIKKPPIEINGEASNYASIVTSYRELAILGFGQQVPTTIQIEETKKAVEALREGVKITMKDGTERIHSLCWVYDKIKRPHDKTQYIKILLSPIFAYQAATNFAKYPQDAMMRLSKAVKKRTISHLILMDTLAMQKPDKPYIRYVTSLATEIGLGKEMKKNKKRVLHTTLPKLFESMVKIKLLLDVPKEKVGATGEKQFIFHINGDFADDEKEIKNNILDKKENVL